jgi:TRAP-type C4-dicarboxylate transport system permease small subunit
MRRTIDRLAESLSRLIEALGVALLAVLLLGVGAQVILRYGFGLTALWSEEVGRYLLIHTTLIGAAVSVHRRQHIRLDVILTALPGGLRAGLTGLNRLVALIVLAVLTWYGIDSMPFMWGMNSSALRIPLAWGFLGVPVYFGLAAVFAALDIARGPFRPDTPVVDQAIETAPE